MKRLLITGGSGYLGAHLASAAGRGWDWRVTCFSRPITAHPEQALRLDLRDEQAVSAAVQALRPAAIVHTACSNASPEQIQAIVPAARNLAQAASAVGARLVHVSTDLVFDGEHAPYADDDAPAPIMEYGQAKAEAEALVLRLCPSAAIVRPSLIWGLDPLDRQTTWLVEGLRHGERITLFVDELRSPVYVHDLCAALLELAERPDVAGALNMGGAQALSRWDFGLRLLAALGLAPWPNLLPGMTAQSGLVRARDLTLISARAAQRLRARLRGVDEVLGTG